MNSELIDNPAEELVEKLDAIKSLDHPYVNVPEFDNELLNSVPTSQLELASLLAEAAPAVAEFHQRYIEDYLSLKNWHEFGFLNADYALQVSEKFRNAAEYAASNPELQDMAAYLAAVSYDWRHIIHRFHPFSRSEVEFYKGNNSASLAVRSSPGLERYIYPEFGGNNASFNLRLGEAVEDDARFQAVKGSIISFLHAEDLSDRFNFTVRRDTFILGAGLHGKSSPGASQYALKDDNSFNLVININSNLQRAMIQPLLAICEEHFSEERFAMSKDAFVHPDIELFGHEVAEAFIEARFPNAIAKLGGREPIEIVSTLSVLEALRLGRNYYGGIYNELYEDTVWRVIAKTIRGVNLDNPDLKFLVYKRGYQLADKAFRSAGAFHMKEGRIDSINWPVFDDTLHLLTSRLLDIISTGNRQENDKLFQPFKS